MACVEQLDEKQHRRATTVTAIHDSVHQQNKNKKKTTTKAQTTASRCNWMNPSPTAPLFASSRPIVVPISGPNICLISSEVFSMRFTATNIYPSAPPSNNVHTSTDWHQWAHCCVLHVYGETIDGSRRQKRMYSYWEAIWSWWTPWEPDNNSKWQNGNGRPRTTMAMNAVLFFGRSDRHIRFGLVRTPMHAS